MERGEWCLGRAAYAMCNILKSRENGVIGAIKPTDDPTDHEWCGLCFDKVPEDVSI